MKIVIAGAGEIGSHLAKMLRDEDNEITVIDSDEQRIRSLTNEVDVHAVTGSPTSLSMLRQAGAGKADLFISVIPGPTQEMNIVSALLAKRIGAGKVIARTNEKDYLSAENKLIFKEMGIEHMFYPERAAADEIVGYLNHNATAESMEFGHGRLKIAAFKLDEESPMLDMSLGEFTSGLALQDRQSFRIIAIARDGKTIVPGAATKFRYGDQVFTISRKEGFDSLHNSFGKVNETVRSVMILGGTAIAKMLAELLVRQGIRVKILESDSRRCSQLSEDLPDSVLIANVDGRNSDVLFDEGIKDYDAFIALTENDESNVLACVMARKFNVFRTVAEVENIEYMRLAEEMGVNNAINKKLITAGRIFRFTLTGRARFVRYMDTSRSEVIEYTVAPGAAITKKPLREIDFPEGAIIGGVIRGNDAFIAVGDTVIEKYDHVAVFATPESAREVDRFFK